MINQITYYVFQPIILLGLTITIIIGGIGFGYSEISNSIQSILNLTNYPTISATNTNQIELIKELEGHNSSVLALAFSPDGKQLASGSNDNSVILWGIPDGDIQLTFNQHVGDIFTVAYSTDGRLIASGGDDNSIRLWQPTDGKLVHHLLDHRGWVHAVSFSPDGRRLASGGDDKATKIWSISSGNLLESLSFGGHVFDVAYSPDKTILD